MFKGHKIDDITYLEIYNELLKRLDSFENTLVNNDMPTNLFIIVIVRVSLLLEILNILPSLNSKTKKLINNIVNKQLEQFISILLNFPNIDNETNE